MKHSAETFIHFSLNERPTTHEFELGISNQLSKRNSSANEWSPFVRWSMAHKVNYSDWTSLGAVYFRHVAAPLSSGSTSAYFCSGGSRYRHEHPTRTRTPEARWWHLKLKLKWFDWIRPKWRVMSGFSSLNGHRFDGPPLNFACPRRGQKASRRSSLTNTKTANHQRGSGSTKAEKAQPRRALPVAMRTRCTRTSSSTLNRPAGQFGTRRGRSPKRLFRLVRCPRRQLLSVPRRLAN